MKPVLSLICFLLCASSLAGLAAPKPDFGLRKISVENAVATAIDGSRMPYELGTIFVPENRTKPDSRLITVGFARVKAARPTGAPPVFMLVGGPGVTMLDIVLDKDDVARRRVKAWQAYADVADLVVIEQRGYTRRGDMLVYRTKPLPLDRPMTTEQEIATVRDMARTAHAAYPAADLSGYTITALADDVDDLRRALGYDQISLDGASFGSQWAFAVMRSHPGSVARAVISSTEPLHRGFDMPSEVYAAIGRIAWEADADAGLKPYLPRGGLMAAIRETCKRLTKGSVSASVTDAGTAKRVVMGLEDYQYALVAHAAEAATFPAFVLSTYRGDYADWAREEIAWRASDERSLINPLINIGIDISADRRALILNDPALPIIGRWDSAAYMATKGEWPTGDVGDAYRRPVSDSTPVLFVQGDWDINTPVENALEMQTYFPNSRVVLLHRGQHNGATALLRGRPEIKAKVYRFLKDGTTADLPTNVDLDPVKFTLPRAVR